MMISSASSIDARVVSASFRVPAGPTRVTGADQEVATTFWAATR